MRTFRLAMAQINPTVGDLPGNADKIIRYICDARLSGADLIAFPELAISGYPPEDLLFKPQFVQENRKQLERIVRESHGISVVVGFVDADGGLYNAAAIIHDAELVGVYHKMYLPNYGVFDEDRYFKAGSDCPVYVINGVGLGVNICEDIWYPVGPTTLQRNAGAQVIININGSPFHLGKQDFREQMLSGRAADHDLYICYTNMVGGQDELVFDGASMVFNNRGELVACGGQFQEELLLTDLEIDKVSNTQTDQTPLYGENLEILEQLGTAKRIHVSDFVENTNRLPITERTTLDGLKRPAEAYQALVLGTRDYVHKNGFDKVLIGLSGGVDSSLTAAIAAAALGSENVVCVAMPSRYSSEGSVVDAKLLSENLGVELRTIAIEPAFTAHLGMLEPHFRNTDTGVAEENLQARVRGNILMSLSNKFGWLVLTTGNKSEMATGYSTLYGDMAGGFAVIKDVPKTLVYDICTHINEHFGKEIIPRSVIEKPPSAELRPDQKDEDSLPPYEILDPILEAYVEQDHSYQEMVASGHNESHVRRVIQLVDRSEYKRRQAPPGIKITPRNFGRDRRMPIVNKYKEF